MAQSTPQQPETNQPRQIHAIGRLQPAGGVVSINGTPGDRLVRLRSGVAANQAVPTDGVLGVLESHERGLAQLDAVRTRLELAREKQKVDQELADANLTASYAAVEQAKAKRTEARLQSEQVTYLQEAVAIAEDEYQSLQDLRESDPDLVTPHQLRKQANEIARASSEVRLAEQRIEPMISAAASAYEAAMARSEAARITAENARRLSPATAIEKELRVVEQTLKQSLLWAPGADRSSVDLTNPPIDQPGEPGSLTILSVYAQPGEMLSQFPVMDVADVSSLECIAEVYEADAKLIQIGQLATLSSNAFGEGFAAKIRGRVTSVANVVSSPGLANRNPLAPQDRSIVEVRLAILAEPEGAIAEAAKRIGLQVDVRFDSDDAPAPGRQ